MITHFVNSIIAIIVAFICGAIGAKIAGAGKSGCLGFMVLGLIGSFLGPFVAYALHFPEFATLTLFGKYIYINPVFRRLIWNVMGAIIFVAILNFLGLRNK